MASYDYPFNERIRTLLRIEDLLVKLLYHVEADHEHQHHWALLILLQILEVIGRTELKSDLLQELHHQRMVMVMLKGNPAIAAKKLESILDDIDAATEALHAETTKLGQTLRANEWLMSIKQRSGIPGGICEFDMPSYHYWLGLSAEKRKQDLQTWLQPLLPMQQAIGIILHILRGSGATTQLMTSNGAYQQMLVGAKLAQMLRIEVADDLTCFPEVSANKYAINIRFNSLDCAQKLKQCDQDIKFALTLCNL